MIGHCLCEQIRFEIDGCRFKLYQCHCSLCRRQGGASGNTATLVPRASFRWTRGAATISTWTSDTGFRSHFCPTCGAPVPNPLRDTPYVWIPAGLLEDATGLEIVAHLCVASKAQWDTAALQGACFDGLPDFEALIDILRARP